MLELIGPCSNCGKEVFCRDGFLDGVYLNEELICFECEEELQNEMKRKKAVQ